jgi:hypothetical protein
MNIPGSEQPLPGWVCAAALIQSVVGAACLTLLILL